MITRGIPRNSTQKWMIFGGSPILGPPPSSSLMQDVLHKETDNRQWRCLAEVHLLSPPSPAQEGLEICAVEGDQSAVFNVQKAALRTIRRPKMGCFLPKADATRFFRIFFSPRPRQICSKRFPSTKKGSQINLHSAISVRPRISRSWRFPVLSSAACSREPIASTARKFHAKWP